MLQNKSFVKKTKGGKIIKVVREHYLRDDIWSGSPLDPECDPASHKLSADAPAYLVVDTNVALHQMDFLEHSSIKDVIICSTVMEEVEHRNRAGAQRLRNLIANPDKRFYLFSNEHHKMTHVKAEAGESPNDRNDRAIRVVAKWYADRIPGKPILLLTNDAGNRAAAAALGVTALHLSEYAARRKEVPELLDLVARLELPSAGEVEEQLLNGTKAMSVAAGKGSSSRPSKRARMYEAHKPAAELAAGLAAGRYHQGTLRVNRFNPFEGWVTSDSIGQDILVSGRIDMNRALEGDVVVVELLPEEEWKGPSNFLPGGRGKSTPGDSQEGSSEGSADAEDAEAAGAQIFQVAGESNLEDLAAEGRRPTGRVVGVMKRNWRERGYCGSLKPGDVPAGNQTISILFVPVERRLPMIRIQTRQAAALMDKRIVVVIDGWEQDSLYPHGHYVRTLGTIGDKETETEVVLVEHDINTAPFTPAVHACVPPLPWAVTEADLADPHREDLRSICVCSVDPPGCKDIDDALHCRELPNGNLEVGVHIADVTHFLLPGTAMDLEASARATTTYLVNRRIDMLPKPLTEDICSLRGNVERLAFSAIWEMTRDAEVVRRRFTKSVICSRAALTYQQAQERIDKPELNDEVTKSLRHLMSLSKVLKGRRAAAGALQLASPEVKFTIDDSAQDALDMGMYQLRDTNSMVEELMLLANIAVAEEITAHFPACALLRRHQTPPPRQFEPLLKAARCAGLTLDTSSSKALADSLDRAVRASDPYFNKLLRIMATRCMMQAVYFGSGEVAANEYHHYGLATPIYTHFTSPIRRYADVVVHRLLAAVLGLSPLPAAQRDREALHACAGNLNTRHRNAQMAGRSSVELYTVFFFKDRRLVADARVTKVKANGLIVFVPKYGIEGPVYLTEKDGSSKQQQGQLTQQWLLDEERQTVRTADGSQAYSLFDKCAVSIHVQETTGHRQTLVLQLVPRDQLPGSEVVG